MTAQPRGADSNLEVGVAVAAPADWPTLLDAAAAADYSHTSHWHDSFCAHRPGARQLWFTVRDQDQLVAGLGAVLSPAVRRLAGVVPLHRLDSSVDGTSGGPLVHPDLSSATQDELFIALTDAFLARRPGGLATAALALNPLSEKRFGSLLVGRAGWVRHDSPTAMISLAGGLETVQSQRLVMNKRNERNRGLKRGAEVFATTDAALLDAYYPIYTRACAHWGHTPTPVGLLTDLLADPHDRVFLTCVRVEDQVIGGHLCLHLGQRVFAWNGVTDPAFARSHFPATLCFWGDLVEACRRGARWLDCGASGGVHSLTGFKKYFGAELQPRGYYVNDAASLRLLRVVKRRTGGAGPGGQRKWHDGRSGTAGPGGSG
jgi:hypothetical protein